MNEPLVDSAGILSRALAVYREHAAVLFPAALIVSLFQAMAILTGADSVLAYLLLAVASVIASAFFQAMAVEVARDAQDGRADRSVGELLSGARPVVAPLVLVSLLAVIGIGVGLVLLIVPGLMLLTIWVAVIPVVVIERPPGIGAFRRSHELVRGHGWPVFGLIAMVGALSLVIVFATTLIAVGLGETAGSFVQLVVGAAIAPVVTLVTTVLYFRLVELDAARSGTFPPPSGPPVAPPGGPGEPPAA